MSLEEVFLHLTTEEASASSAAADMAEPAADVPADMETPHE